jgi:type VI secretion system protein ImpD
MITEVSISERQEKELSDFGLIPLMRNPNTDFGIFYGNQSIQQPRRYDRTIATANAKLSSMLQYVLCVARFAHYIKVIGRDRIGAFATPEACEVYLQRWLGNYCMANDDLGGELRMRYPLRNGQVQVKELPGKTGSYTCVAHLQPHFQLDQVASSFRLVTELAPAKPEG